VNRSQKASVVSSLREKVTNASLVVITKQKGLNAQEVANFRNCVREGGAEYQVTKNSLARRAVEETQLAVLAEHFTGVTAITYSSDPIAAAKIAVKYANENEKFSIVCGALNGAFLDAHAIKEIAILPSLDTLRGKIVGLIQAPAQRVATLVQAVPSGVARVISAYSEK
jgi:large subunit ribosomal protein L10